MDRDSPPASPANPDVSKPRQVRIRSIVYEFLAKKSSGEHVSIEDYQASHPDLMPELGHALSGGVRKLRLFTDAERAQGSEPAVPFSEPSPRASNAPFRPVIRYYTLVREISSGSQGTVFEAIHDSTNRRVAVKVMTGVSKHSVARFDREARAMAGLSHPGLVDIIDRGRTADGAYFLTMEFIPGHDLDEWVAQQDKISKSQQAIIRVFSKIASAIDEAHRQGIVHRDLKPSNIRIDGYAEPHVVDFGLAHLLDDNDRNLTVTGNIVGSIPWASPEQALGATSQLSPASDVYSLGVLLYQSFTGQFPYPVDAPLHVVTRSICEMAPTAPDTLRNLPFGRVDAGMSEIILRCLAKKPQDRFATGGALAAALGEYLQGKYQAAPRSSAWRHRIAAIVALGVVACGVLAARWPAVWETPALQIQLPAYRNVIGMEMVRIPAGSFQMGSTNNERGHEDNEDVRMVHISQSFDLSRTEVTRGQYRRVMGSLPSGSASDGDDRLPVDFVSWSDANAFCEKLSEMDGRKYRLPTEAEWEYACRSGTRGAYAGSGKADDIAWHAGNSEQRLHPVGTKAANQWGLFDMHGNAAEWVLDSYVKYLGRVEARDPLRSGAAGSHVIRGGNAQRVAEQCRSASRGQRTAYELVGFVGFRVVQGPIPEPVK